MEKHTITPENALKIIEWLNSSRNVALWESVNLSNPGYSLLTPAITDGKPTEKPSWQVSNMPAKIFTSIDDFQVTRYKEKRRFHVAIRRGSNNPFMFKCTDASTRKIYAAIEKIPDSHYAFDYETQEAVIYVPDSTIPLTEWKE